MIKLGVTIYGSSRWSKSGLRSNSEAVLQGVTFSLRAWLWLTKQLTACPSWTTSRLAFEVSDECSRPAWSNFAVLSKSSNPASSETFALYTNCLEAVSCQVCRAEMLRLANRFRLCATSKSKFFCASESSFGRIGLAMKGSWTKYWHVTCRLATTPQESFGSAFNDLSSSWAVRKGCAAFARRSKDLLNSCSGQEPFPQISDKFLCHCL